MNLGKARDYFSAYYEGSLDRGLKQSFEGRLREDAQLQTEYKAFERTMKDLEALGLVEIEPPADLHEKISARLDRAVWEQKRAKSPGLNLSWWKAFVMGAAVVSGLFIGLYKLHAYGLPDPSNAAGVMQIIPESQAQFSLESRNQSTYLSFPAVDHATVVIKDSSGKVLDSVVLDHQGIDKKPLANDSDSAQLLSIETADETGPLTYVALPGKKRDATATGKGSVKDLAVALAGHYGETVVVQAKRDADKNVSWDLSSGDATAAARDSVKALGLSISEEEKGFILIQS